MTSYFFFTTEQQFDLYKQLFIIITETLFVNYEQMFSLLLVLRRTSFSQSYCVIIYILNKTNRVIVMQSSGSITSGVDTPTAHAHHTTTSTWKCAAQGRAWLRRTRHSRTNCSSWVTRSWRSLWLSGTCTGILQHLHRKTKLLFC